MQILIKYDKITLDQIRNNWVIVWGHLELRDTRYFQLLARPTLEPFSPLINGD